MLIDNFASRMARKRPPNQDIFEAKMANTITPE
jgi:hypothetical protein